jgi:hypothetical protein
MMPPTRGSLGIPRRRLLDKGVVLVLCLAYAGSRGAVYALGIRSAEALPQMHALDRDLLTGDLLRSLYYLHIQPPLFNGALGALFKLTETRAALALSITYWLLGLALTLAIFSLLRRLEVGPLIAGPATLIYMLGPAPLLYETFTLYTYPTAAFLVLAALAVHRYASSGSGWDALAIAALVTAVALTRSLFHLAWVVAAVLLVALLRPPTRRSAVLLAAPVLVVGLLYLKNFVIFGTFGPSTLVGLNLYRASTELLTSEERLELVERGVLSRFALYPVNNPITRYPVMPEVVGRVDLSSPRAVPALARGWWREAEGAGEEQFVWSFGSQSILVLPPAGPDPVVLSLRAAPLDLPGMPAQGMSIRASGRHLAELELAPGVADYQVEIPSGYLLERWNIVSFHYREARSPREMGFGDDNRLLAVRWLGIGFDPPVGLAASADPPPRLGTELEIPALDRVMRLDGGPNLNHGRFPAVMREYERDARRVMARHPGLYGRAVARAGLIFLAPPMEHPAFRQHRASLATWDRLYSALFYGALDRRWPDHHSHESRWRPTAELLGRVSWISLGLTLLVLPAVMRAALRAPRAPANAVILFCLFNVLAVAVLGSLFEYGENNRFRMMIEPLWWVVVVAGAARILARPQTTITHIAGVAGAVGQGLDAEAAAPER